MSNRGQTLVFLVVALPVFLVICGVLIRSGKTLWVHGRAQGRCDAVVLDGAARLAQGLESLGKINPYARRVIQMRRVVDKLIAASTMAPAAMASLIRARLTLMKAQQMIAAKQALIKGETLTAARQILNERPPRFFSAKVEEKTPEKAFALCVRDENEFRGETGAPLALTPDFDRHQRVSRQLKVFTERFLEKWQGFSSLPAMTVQCEAKILMKDLESSWEVNITPLGDKPLLKPLLLSSSY